MLHNFVISMTTAKQRREHIRQEFGKYNIPFEFFDAVTPEMHLNTSIQQFVPNLANQDKLSKGEKGCFMSHVLLWHKCVEENLPYIAIYEDDIILGQDSKFLLTDDKWLQDYLSLNNGFFILRFETMLMKIGEKAFTEIPISSLDTTYKLNILTSTHYGTAAYVISQATARYLLTFVRHLPAINLKPLDHVLFRNYLNTPQQRVYQLNPAIAIQENILLENSVLKSDIAKDRTNVLHTKKEKLSIPAKLIREIKKIPEALRKALFYKKVDFHQ